MVINKRCMLQYLLIWIAFMDHDSLLVHNYKSAFVIIGLVICFMTLIFYKSSRKRDLLLFLVYLLFMITFVRFINKGGVGISILGHWILEILSISLAYQLDSQKFYDRFVSLISFYALISVVCTILYYMIPDVWNAIMPLNYLSHMPFRGILVLHNASSHGDKLGRNLGVFTEPGLYQISLNTALYILLLLDGKLSFSRGKKNKKILIILLAILTAKSTTGYLAMLAIVLVAVIQSNLYIRKKLVIMLGVGSCLLLLDYLLNTNSSIVYNVLLSKLFDSSGFNLGAGTGYYRIRTIKYAIEVVKLYPWGAGYDNYYNYISMQGQYLNELVGVECLKAFAYYGIVPTSIVYMWLIKMLFKNRRNIMMFLLVIFLYLNTTLAQSDIFYPSLILLFIINQRVIPKCEYEKNRGDIENGS